MHLSQANRSANAKLSDLFTRLNLSELPAMSATVQELCAITEVKDHRGINELTDIILKDYALTLKILKTVNSAFYALPKRVTMISQAINVIGFTVIRDLARHITILEDSIKAGLDREGLSKILASSFLSGLLAREIALRKKMKINPEEAYICSLLHNLGKCIIFVYMPKTFRDIEILVERDRVREEDAAGLLLNGLTYGDIGRELALFWDLPDKVAGAMQFDPSAPEDQYNDNTMLAALAAFTNRLIAAICRDANLKPLVKKYGPLFSLTKVEALAMILRCLDLGKSNAGIIKSGLANLKIKGKTLQLQQTINT